MIDFFNAKQENAAYRIAIEEAFQQVLDSGHYLMGAQLEAFEDEFSRYCDIEHAVGVGSGTQALTLMLKAAMELGMLEAGDEVIVPANSFVASAMGVSEAGLRPVFADVDPVTLNLDREGIENSLTPRSRAVLAVHLYGQVCDMDMLRASCKEHNLLLFEDAAQALGSRWLGKPAGTHGLAGAFSFYPTKNLGALGDAGAIVTGNAELASVIKKLRNYGSELKHEHQYIGGNSRIDEFQASFLRVKLPFTDASIRRRREIATLYNDGLADTPLTLPALPADIENHSWHLYVPRHQNRDDLIDFLKARDIFCAIHYPKCIHQHEAYQDSATRTLAVAESATETVFSLPNGAALRNEQVDTIIETLKEYPWHIGT